MSDHPPETVEDVFDVPYGPLVLPAGRWWANRRVLSVDPTGRITVLLSDGDRMTSIDGAPETLRRVAEAIVAQVDSAEANTPRWPRELLDLVNEARHRNARPLQTVDEIATQILDALASAGLLSEITTAPQPTAAPKVVRPDPTRRERRGW